jgi:hypothetical protein
VGHGRTVMTFLALARRIFLLRRFLGWLCPGPHRVWIGRMSLVRPASRWDGGPAKPRMNRNRPVPDQPQEVIEADRDGPLAWCQWFVKQAWPARFRWPPEI